MRPELAGPLENGMRVSLELPEAGTCVAVVSQRGQSSLTLDLLDDLPDGELEPGSTLDLFMPRPEGIYHWLCSLNSLPLGPAGGARTTGLADGGPAPLGAPRRRRTRGKGPPDAFGPQEPSP